MSEKPDALLLIAPGCPHCPVVLDALGALVKGGDIGSLEVVNVALRPERAEALGVRSVPWTRIGPYTLEGVQTPAALKSWAARAATGEGAGEYLRDLLANGRLGEAERFVAASGRLDELLPFIEEVEAPMQVRLGANAVLEGYADSAELAALVPRLAELSTHRDHRVRSDACHLLGLSGSAEAVPVLKARLDDDSAEVREIAAESLEAQGG